MPGISGVSLFRGDRSPAGWFAEQYGAATAVDTGNIRKSSSIRMAEIRHLFPDRDTASLSVSVRNHLPRGKKRRKLIVCKISDIEFSKLRISRAHIKLLCIPEGAAKIVSLARIGNYEVRMMESSESDSGAAPLFSIELFDHDEQSPVDSCISYSLDEGVAAFQDFISR
jgi:hypothetical protein